MYNVSDRNQNPRYGKRSIQIPLLRPSASVCLYLIWILVPRTSCQPETKTSFARTSLKYDAPIGKVSLAPEISVDDLEKIIDVHNQLRRLQKASDMQLLKWHSFLATLAEEWVERCTWTHGQLSQDPNVRSFQSVGQSMHASPELVDAGEVIRQWYGNLDDFNNKTLACRSGNRCKLYTQVVWASSLDVGCASKLCDELIGLGWRKANFFVCNYAPSGGWSKEAPFRTGQECSKCQSGGLWCEKGLCNSFCQESGLKCVCKAECGCGQLDPLTCTCSCGVGWQGPDCTERCIDGNTNCASSPSWSLSSCSEETDNGRMVRRTCPATCQLCQAANSSFPAACTTAPPEPEKEAEKMNTNHQHLTQPNILLILWTIAAATWMLAAQWISCSGSCREHQGPAAAGTFRDLGSSECFFECSLERSLECSLECSIVQRDHSLS